jgi:hypothetical protein
LALVVASGLDLIYEIFMIVSVGGNQSVQKIIKFLKYKDFLSYLIIIMMHFWRLTPQGKVCSGDYLVNDSDSTHDQYLVQRGLLIWILLLCTWGILIIGTISAFGVVLYQSMNKNNQTNNGDIY